MCLCNSNIRTPYCNNCAKQFADKMNSQGNKTKDTLLRKLRYYKFTDENGHSLENCLDFIELVSLIK
jgi:hypothetical protein